MLKLKLGATYYTVINDFKAISVTYDLTKAEKMPHVPKDHGKKFSTFPCLQWVWPRIKKVALIIY